MTTGSRALHSMAKAEELFIQTKPSRMEQWTGGVCVGGMSGSGTRVSGETCGGG